MHFLILLIIKGRWPLISSIIRGLRPLMCGYYTGPAAQYNVYLRGLRPLL